MRREVNKSSYMSQNNNGTATTVRLTMYIMRHGVAYHNIPHRSSTSNKIEPPCLHDTRYTDSKLVLPRAHQQARKAGRILRQAIQNKGDQDGKKKVHLDGVIVSPLSRCLETAYFVVDELIESNDKKNNPNEIFSRFHWACKEDLREAYGIHYSDKRSCKSFLQENWPQVEFEPEMTDLDEKWSADKRESIHDVFKRIDSFLLWLSWIRLALSDSNNKSRKFLVVSHGVWIECLLKKYSPEVLSGGKRVYNCDLYHMDIVSEWKQKISVEGEKWYCQKIFLENVTVLDS